MAKYFMFLNVLDRIREEATHTKFSPTYLPDASALEAVNQARARAFIHLYLKVGFGVLDFAEREHVVTDGTYDGGIDGYYIHNESKTIYFIQSKFRATEANFENKKLSLDEILVMDINRVLNGETRDEAGNEYSGKIKQLQREVSQTEDIARYKYKVVLLASLEGWSSTKLSQLTGGYSIEVFDHERCYKQLVFPVVAGTFFNASDVSIYIDLSNKNAGAKISYTVSTKYNDCEITALFVPTLEIAKILHKYKNSVLRFNPRSYLELAGQKVNMAIRETILNTKTNEFALFNNGITILSDETHINEKIGQKNKAQLTLLNPQIINGGQTAYTLSRIFEERTLEESQELFKDKEVLLKVITLIDMEGHTASAEQKLDLIDRISEATNQQTPVITADRHSNERIQIEIQRTLFERYGLLYERKRGEFADGLHKHDITPTQVLERNLFFGIFVAARGQVNEASKKKLFVRFKNPEETIADPAFLDKVYFAFLCYPRVVKTINLPGRIDRTREIFAKLFALTLKYAPDRVVDFEPTIGAVLPGFDAEWQKLLAHVAATSREFYREVLDRTTNQKIRVFSASKWTKSARFEHNVRSYFYQAGSSDGRP